MTAETDSGVLKLENDMRKAIVSIVALGGLAIGSGCIGVSASETRTMNSDYQIAVVDDEIYLVDVNKKTARKVRIEGIDEYDAATVAESATLSEAGE